MRYCLGCKRLSSVEARFCHACRKSFFHECRDCRKSNLPEALGCQHCGSGNLCQPTASLDLRWPARLASLGALALAATWLWPLAKPALSGLVQRQYEGFLNWFLPLVVHTFFFLLVLVFLCPPGLRHSLWRVAREVGSIMLDIIYLVRKVLRGRRRR